MKSLNVLHKHQDESYVAPVHDESLMNNHTLFRKVIEVCDTEKETIMYISADDYYKLYVNGKYVT